MEAIASILPLFMALLCQSFKASITSVAVTRFTQNCNLKQFTQLRNYWLASYVPQNSVKKHIKLDMS